MPCCLPQQQVVRLAGSSPAWGEVLISHHWSGRNLVSWWSWGWPALSLLFPWQHTATLSMQCLPSDHCLLVPFWKGVVIRGLYPQLMKVAMKYVSLSPDGTKWSQWHNLMKAIWERCLLYLQEAVASQGLYSPTRTAVIVLAQYGVTQHSCVNTPKAIENTLYTQQCSCRKRIYCIIIAVSALWFHQGNYFKKEMTPPHPLNSYTGTNSECRRDFGEFLSLSMSTNQTGVIQLVLPLVFNYP